MVGFSAVMPVLATQEFLFCLAGGAINGYYCLAIDYYAAPT
jgi:hypothetical protein